MKIETNHLKAGMIVGKTIMAATSKVPILPSGKVLTDDLIKRLVGMGIEEIEVELSPTDADILKKNNGIKTTFSNAEEKYVEASVNNISNSIKKCLKKSDISFDKAVESASMIVQKIFLLNTLSYDLNKYKDYGNDDYNKAFRVASFAAILANMYNKNANIKDNVDVHKIVMASMLYNIGKLCENDDLRHRLFGNTIVNTQFKERFPKLDVNCFIDYNPNMIPLYSFFLMKASNNFAGDVTTISLVLYCFENDKKSGPLGFPLQDDDHDNIVSASAKIINTAVQYDDLLNKVIENKEGLNNVEEILQYRAANREISPKFTKLLLKAIPLYSPGSRVVITDNNRGERLGKVVYNDNTFSRPHILFMDEYEERIPIITSTVTKERFAEYENYELASIKMKDGTFTVVDTGGQIIPKIFKFEYVEENGKPAIVLTTNSEVGKLTEVVAYAHKTVNLNKQIDMVINDVINQDVTIDDIVNDMNSKRM